MRNSLHFLTLLAYLLVPPIASRSAEVDDKSSATDPIHIYFGTHTFNGSQGIYFSTLDPITGAISKPELAAELPNPTFLAIHPNKKFLYACSEYGNGGNPASYIAAFSIDPAGKLALLNHQPLPGGPCYCLVDATGNNLLAACYGNGTLAKFKILPDGKLAADPWIDQHPGTGTAHPPHAHCFDPDPANRYALANDLGLDRVYVYRFDPIKGLLAPNDPPFATLPAGSGPRHLVFAANGKFVYSINELNSTITAFTYDAGHGTLDEVQTVSTLPKDFAGKSSCAELLIHPSGKYLYGSNRGDDSIVQFAIDEPTGKLTLVGHTPTAGKTPRSFAIDPTGHWLIAANQDSNSLIEFKLDAETGKLKPTDVKYEMGAPVYVKFVGKRNE
jgi:6-phosphogluconolactonase